MQTIEELEQIAARAGQAQIAHQNSAALASCERHRQALKLVDSRQIRDLIGAEMARLWIEGRPIYEERRDAMAALPAGFEPAQCSDSLRWALVETSAGEAGRLHPMFVAAGWKQNTCTDGCCFGTPTAPGVPFVDESLGQCGPLSL